MEEKEGIHRFLAGEKNGTKRSVDIKIKQHANQRFVIPELSSEATVLL